MGYTGLSFFGGGWCGRGLTTVLVSNRGGSILGVIAGGVDSVLGTIMDGAAVVGPGGERSIVTGSPIFSSACPTIVNPKTITSLHG